jgi:UDP-N-acetyl-D-glucosamine dehydrogenase
LKSGRDFLLAFSPEREDPHNPDFSTSSIPKVVGGDGPDALAAACALYGAFVEHVIPVSSTETAEAVKIMDGDGRGNRLHKKADTPPHDFACSHGK